MVTKEAIKAHLMSKYIALSVFAEYWSDNLTDKYLEQLNAQGNDEAALVAAEQDFLYFSVSGNAQW